MPRHSPVALSLLLLALPGIPGARAGELAPPIERFEKVKAKDLPEKYRTWLEDEVHYIISDRERDVFLRLSTDKLRDIFIDQFWARRDPVPSTEENEYRDDYVRRLAHCREYYPNLRQDMARIYLTLGKPTKINPNPSDSNFWPMEVWEYEGMTIPTLPARMTLLFFKPRNGSAFRLWSPTVDGFQALRTTSPSSASSDREFNPGRFLPNIFAEAMRGVAAGMGPFGTERVLLEIQRPPAVNLTGVERILTGSVTTTLSYGALPVQAVAKWYFSESPGVREVSIALEVPSPELRFTSYQGKDYLGLFMAGQVRREPKGSRPVIVAEWSGEVDTAFTPEERTNAKGFPLLYAYRLKLLPGSYGLNVVARDDTSERLGIADIPIELPAYEAGYQLSDIVFATKLSRLEDGSGNVFAPFVFERVEMVPSVDQKLSASATATLFVQLKHPETPPGAEEDLKLHYVLRSGDGKEALHVTEALARGRANAAGVQSILKQLDLAAVPAGSYEAVVELRAGDRLRAATRTKMSVVAAPVVTGRLIARGFQAADPAAAATSAGMQLLAEGRYLEAREELRLALAHDPDRLDAKINLARALVLSGEPAAARDAMLEVSAAVEAPEALMVLGAAHGALGEPAKAAEAYRRAIAAAGESSASLNALAEALSQAGDAEGARKALTRSLEIEPDQPLARKLLESLPATPPTSPEP